MKVEVIEEEEKEEAECPDCIEGRIYFISCGDGCCSDAKDCDTCNGTGKVILEND